MSVEEVLLWTFAGCYAFVMLGVIVYRAGYYCGGGDE
jgi:hypothetical protein